MRRQFGIRKFGGKHTGIYYRFSRDFNHKLEAKNFAAQKRKSGHPARVTTEKDQQGRKYYIVWVR